MKPARLTLLLSPHSARRLSSRDPRDETRAVSSSGACSSERGMAVAVERPRLLHFPVIGTYRHVPRAKHQKEIQCELCESVSIWCALFCKNKFRFELTPFRTKRNPM